jgi:hypothetical protein
VLQQAEGPGPSTRVREVNVLVRYYEELTSTPIPSSGPSSAATGFEPLPAFPVMDEALSQFLAPATASYHVLDDVRGVGLHLLDLRRNPATQTTKTLPSLLIVARAVEHIRRTGEPILLFSPSSGNKAIALRDAVERALRLGLASPSDLRVLTLTPEAAVSKLRRSRLSDDPQLRTLNPVAVLRGPVSEAVKAVGAEFAATYHRGRQAAGSVWSTLRLDNYRRADVARALFDAEFGTAGDSGRALIHAHAVSSAYGLLGYQTGLARLRARGRRVNQPGYLLVQHLATCDMVLHTLYGDFDRARIPRYRTHNGLWVQGRSPHFPLRTWAPEEALEETFYTREPVTAAEMSGLIARHGGTGIVVSLLECMERYADCRDLLRDTDVSLPDDPRDLQEWSLVMALTGVLNAADRGLVGSVDTIVLHASGSYGRHDFARLQAEHVHWVDDAEELLAVVRPTAEVMAC